MRPAPAPGYWLRRSAVVGYTPFRRVLELKDVAARIVDSPGLDDLYTRDERIAAVNATVPGTLELMLTLSYAGELANATQRR